MKRLLATHRLIGTCIALTGMLLAGCATSVPPYDYSAFKQSRPRSILVLPPTNASPDVNATPAVLARSVRPLAEAGYYVLPVSLMYETFRQNGVTDAVNVHSISTTRLQEIFGADAAIYIDIKQYGTSYKVIESATVVAAEAKLVDLKTGATLWSGKATASNQENKNNNQGILGALITAVVQQIISNVSDTSYAVAGTASSRLLSAGQKNGMLYGPRSPKYGSD